MQLYKHLSRKNDNILIEGIGGLLVPITFNKLFLDFIKILNLPVFLVTTNKLGTINHTLLSIHILKENNIKFKIIFNKLDIKKSDRENKAVLKDITRFGKIDNIIQIPFIRPEKLRYSKFCCKVSPAIFNF
ncbi:MAG: ATP-dependent dethiobiotin synthetase BioD [Planctomycetota bacterium]